MSAAPAFQITQHEYTKRVTGSLRLAFVNDRAPVKKLAEVAQCSLATAKNWWEQRNAPEGLHSARLMAAVPEYQAEYRRIAGMAADLDPLLDRAMNEMFTNWMRAKSGGQ